jgi:predicted PurR-regulated permease PerM
MRPGIDALGRRRVPRAVGLLLHYLVIAGAVALLLWLAVPRALDQVQQALKNVPTTATEAKQQARHSSGVKRSVLLAVEKRLKRLPSGTSVLHPAIEATKTAFEVLIAIFFVFATAAYWIFERDRAVTVVTSMLPRPKRRVVRDTWDLIDAKLGAFVRGQLLLIAFVASVLSILFRLVHEPYWLLVGVFAGIVELVPVIGPLAAGALAIGVGFTASFYVALGAGLAVLGVRMLEDYIVVPRVLGHAVGLSPLLVLVGVTATPLLFGGFYVLLAVPIVAVLVTLVDVIVRDKDPAEQEVPAVLFPAKDAEG